MFPEMTDPGYARRQAAGGTRRAGGRALRRALILSIVAAVVFGVSTIALLRGDLPTIAAELAAVVALGAFGVTVFGLLRTVLILIESAGERRREARAATERRTGDRARKPS